MIYNKSEWPLPKFNINDEPHFLFIITPPCSGSTALSQFLNSSYRTMLLQDRGEGQWLLPGLCKKNRWNSGKEVDYSSLKAVWLRKYQEVKRLTQNIDVVIEKSPPNMMRMEELASQFKKVSFIANNRDPYANCASILYRHHDADNLSLIQRKSLLGDLVQNWIMRSTKIRELIEALNAPLLTYEDFCKNPSAVLDILNLPDGVSETINLNSRVKVKDYVVQPIINQNERQILMLAEEEIEHISSLLISSSDLLDFFGYQQRIEPII